MKKIHYVILPVVTFISFFCVGCKNNAQSTSVEKSAPSGSVSSLEQEEIDKIPNKSEYIMGLVSSAISKGESCVTLRPGIYRLTETLVFDGIENFDLRANGATLIMTKPVEVIKIRRCNGLSIRGFTIDYYPIRFTQGTITSISEDFKTVSFELHKGYRDLESSDPSHFKGYPRHFFDRKTRLWKDNVNFFFQPTLQMDADGRKGKAIFNVPQTGIEVGDYVAFDRRWADKYNSVDIRETTGPVLLEDITLYTGLGFCGRGCEGLVTLRRVKVTRGPRPEGATEDRLMATSADASNFGDCRQGPVLEDCDFSFMGDDGLNVHGRFIAVARIKSPTEVLLVHSRKPSENFYKIVKPGDVVRFTEQGNFPKVGESTLLSLTVLEGTEGITPQEVAKYYAEYKDLSKPYTVYSLKLSSPIPFAKAGQWIDIPAINCPNFVVKNSYFHDHRARGIRIMADNGIVEGNRFERIGTSAIQVGPELQFWREAGWVNNLVIRNNQIKDVGFTGGELTRDTCYYPAALVVCAKTDFAKPPYPEENDNIIIENNVIDGCPMGAVYAYAAKNLTIRNNKARNVMQGMTPAYTNRWGLSPKKAFDYEWVSNVKDEGNVVESR